jgi:hypothetical protein
MIHNGYAHAVLSGNAVGVHDVEAALYGSTLGMKADGSGHAGGHRPSHAGRSTRSRRPDRSGRSSKPGDHERHHARADGRERPLRARRVDPRRRPASRDDRRYAGRQAAMREQTTQATMVVMVASALHSIAAGNMLPTFCAAPTVDP